MIRAFKVVFQQESIARKRSGRILPQNTNRKSLRGRVSPPSLVQFRLGTTVSNADGRSNRHKADTCPSSAASSSQHPTVCYCYWAVDGRSRLRLNMIKTELIWTGTTCLRSRAAVLLWHLVLLTLPNQMMSVFSESNSRRICHSTRMSLSMLLVLSAFFKYNNYDASNILLMTTLLLHSFMHSSQAESIIPAVSWLALRRGRPTSCNVSSTWQHESSRTCVSSTGDSLISSEVSYTGWTLLPGFSSESASRCSDVCTSCLLNTCRPTANPSPVFLVVATCDQLTVVISTSHVWNLLRTEDVHLHMLALQIGGTHFLLTLETIVFLFHLLSATSKTFLFFFS